MKKWLIVLLIITLPLIVGIYIFIPHTLNISTIRVINCSKNAANRFLLDKSKWQKWWPQLALSGSDSLPPSNSSFFYNGYSYHVMELFVDKINVLTIDDPDSVSTVINIIPRSNDSITLQWQCSVITSTNPLTRFYQYKKAVRIKNNMVDIFTNLQSFLEKTSNVYEFPIEQIISKDSTLIAIRYLDTAYPRTDEIYLLIDSVKRYIASQDAIETNKPMLRITKLKNNQFQTMIAIPTNKKLEGNTGMYFQRFVPYKTLTCVVKGGEHTIDQGFRQMEIFIEDYQRTSMAVPFQSLVTDRIAEPDSSKWITVICQPVS